MISLTVTTEQNVKKVMSADPLARSETNVDLPKESRKLTPWRLPIWNKVWRIESTIRSVKSVGITKYATIVVVKYLRETEREEERK